MFMGVNSHHDAKRVASYADAQAALERQSRTPTGRARKLGVHGYHMGLRSNHGVTWVRQDDDGSIVFRLYDTDVVTWQPDNSVVIDNFGTLTTSGFASRFLPSSISLNHPSTRCGETAGNCGISFCAGGSWSVCHGSDVRFVECADGSGWEPDLTTCADISWPESGPAAEVRAVYREHNLRDFELWLSVTPHMLPIKHEGYDVEECAEALVARDFERAARHLPLVNVSGGFGIHRRAKPLPIATSSRNYVVTMTSVQHLRLALKERAGLLLRRSAKVVGSRQLQRVTQQVNLMRRLDIPGTHSLGLSA